MNLRERSFGYIYEKKENQNQHRVASCAFICFVFWHTVFGKARSGLDDARLTAVFAILCRRKKVFGTNIPAVQYIDSRVTADAPVRRSGPAYFQKECRESDGESFRRYCSQTIAQLSHARRILLWMKTVLFRRAARRMALRKRSASTPCAFMTAAVKRNRPSVIAEEGTEAGFQV